MCAQPTDGWDGTEAFSKKNVDKITGFMVRWMLFPDHRLDWDRLHEKLVPTSVR